MAEIVEHLDPAIFAGFQCVANSSSSIGPGDVLSRSTNPIPVDVRDNLGSRGRVEGRVELTPPDGRFSTTGGVKTVKVPRVQLREIPLPFEAVSKKALVHKHPANFNSNSSRTLDSQSDVEQDKKGSRYIEFNRLVLISY